MDTTEQNQMVGGRLSKWPVNWGVLAIVLGILGLLFNLFSGFQAGMMFVMPMNDIYGEMVQYKTGDAQGDEAIEDMMAMQGEMMRNMQDMAPMNLVVAALLARSRLLCSWEKFFSVSPSFSR